MKQFNIEAEPVFAYSLFSEPQNYLKDSRTNRQQ